MIIIGLFSITSILTVIAVIFIQKFIMSILNKKEFFANPNIKKYKAYLITACVISISVAVLSWVCFPHVDNIMIYTIISIAQLLLVVLGIDIFGKLLQI